MKVFQIGFNNCGTSSIWQGLGALWFSAPHLKTGDVLNIALTKQSNLAVGRPILTSFEDFDAFADIDEGSQARVVPALATELR